MDTTKRSIMDIVEREARVDLSQIDHDGDLKQQVSIDSLAFVGILAAVVEELEVQVSVEIMASRSFNDIVRVIDDMLQAKTRAAS